MRMRNFSLLEVIGNVLRVGLAVEKGNFQKRWVELIEYLNQREKAERKGQEKKPDSDFPSPVG
jgi:hypothetical protein